MCGRYTLIKAPDILQQEFGLEEVPSLSPRYNIAPTQQVAVVRHAANGERRELVMLRWGLVPSWAKDRTIGNRLLNARADSVAEKPSFRSALVKRRCLVLADGFFEWQNSNGKKQPFYFRVRDGEPFAIAGLWEHWSRGDEIVESCTLITTEANDVVRPTHDRMPVILGRDDHERWLDPAIQDARRIQSLLQPYCSGQMSATPVSMRVNSTRNDDVGCVEPVLLDCSATQRNLFELA